MKVSLLFHEGGKEQQAHRLICEWIRDHPRYFQIISKSYYTVRRMSHSNLILKTFLNNLWVNFVIFCYFWRDKNF